MDFATRLRKMRLENGFTQQQLAKTIGVSTSVIGDIERGARPVSAKVAMKLSNLFETGIDYWIPEDVFNSDINNVPFETIMHKDSFTELNKIVTMMLDNNIINKHNVQNLDIGIIDLLTQVLVSDIEKKILTREQEILKQKQEAMITNFKSKFDEYKND